MQLITFSFKFLHQIVSNGGGKMLPSILLALSLRKRETKIIHLKAKHRSKSDSEKGQVAPPKSISYPPHLKRERWDKWGEYIVRVLKEFMPHGTKTKMVEFMSGVHIQHVCLLLKDHFSKIEQFITLHTVLYAHYSI